MGHNLSINENETVTIYHTGDLCVQQQLGFWYAENTVLRFTPAKQVGLVAIASRYANFGEKRPIYGWLIHRPCALEISFDVRVRYTLVQASSDDMQAWCRKTANWVDVVAVSR